MPPKHALLALRDKLVQSRFFTLSLTFHVILVALIGTTIITQIPPERGEFSVTEIPSARIEIPQPPKDVIQTPVFDPVAPMVPAAPMVPKNDISDVIRTIDPKAFDLGLPPALPGPIAPEPSFVKSPAAPSAPGMTQSLTAEDLKRVTDTARTWKVPAPGSDPRFAFTAYIGRYRGGNWNSTVRVTNNEITGGSLPNLLFAMSTWSKNKIDTNEREVKAIALDSDELLATRPPFIFLTGTRDFVLSDREIDNLRSYIRLGGAVWGDASAPGQRSRFDIAFRREMQRVLGAESRFESLPANHPVFAGGFYPKANTLPAGVNHYADPVEVLRWGGEIAVILTTNDYGDMWQIGLDQHGQIDTARDARGEYVAMNPTLWSHRGIYVRNIDQPAVEQAYKFGINMVVHLLTRWDKVSANSAPL